MEVILLVAIFVIMSYVSSSFNNKKAGGRPSVPVTEEKQEESEAEQQLEPVLRPEPVKVKPAQKPKRAQKPKPAQKPVQKPVQKLVDEPAKEKIDPKKLVIYSEIMKPKFKE